MDLSTTYLGFNLSSPLMPGASPLVDDLDTVRRLEDAGASAIVMHSLFEEQVTREQIIDLLSTEARSESFPESLSFFPDLPGLALTPDQYLEKVRMVKAAVGVPVIGSINGTTRAGWLRYAKLIEQAGADALELNVYYLAMDTGEDGQHVENRTVEILETVKRSVSIPVAVKLSPFFSSVANLASRLDEIGADGLVLFNRFYQPDIDPELLEVVPRLHLSDSSELLLRLRWVAILSGRIWSSLAVTGGVHTSMDAIKSVMVGASAVQVVSALLIHGPEHLGKMRRGMAEWLEEHEYESLEQMRGSMRLQSYPDPGAFERANYMKVLQSWRPGEPGLHD